MFLELRHLRTIAALNDCGNVAAAARQLYQTQSALSHQIKSIENYYSGPVFIRKSKPLRFTPLGERLLRLANEVIPIVQNTEQDILHIAESSHGRLSIAIECHSCFDWLIPTMDVYRQQWDQVEMDLAVGFDFEPAPALARGRVDLVITSDPQDNPDLVFEPLFAYRALLAMAKNHPLASKAFIVPQDLQHETLITYPIEHKRLDIYTHFLDPAGVEPLNQRTSELTVMILQLVASRRGVAALPNWVLTEYLHKDYVVAKPLGQSGMQATLYAAVRKSDRQLAFMDAFIQSARQTAHKILQDIDPINP